MVHDQASLHEDYNVRGYRDISSASAKSPETNVMSFALILHSLMRPVNTPRTRSVYTLRAKYTRDGVRITDHATDSKQAQNVPLGANQANKRVIVAMNASTHRTTWYVDASSRD